jgi:hypothetical protein
VRRATVQNNAVAPAPVDKNAAPDLAIWAAGPRPLEREPGTSTVVRTQVRGLPRFGIPAYCRARVGRQDPEPAL